MQPTDLVPGCQYTAEQLCRVRSIPSGGIVEAGTILVRRGAFQRKYVVESIMFLGLDHRYGQDYVILALTMRPLGTFFADGRFYLAKRATPTQLEVPVRKAAVESSGGVLSMKFRYDLAGFAPCLPIGDVKPVKIKKIVPQEPAAKFPFNPSGGGKVASAKMPKLTPEAILDQFKL